MNHQPLYELAHARTGDKGNRANICLIAYDASNFDMLVEQVTEARIEEHFAHRKPSNIKRYILPQLGAINFVLDDVLDGGVNGALNLDAHGKSLSFHLLSMYIDT